MHIEHTENFEEQKFRTCFEQTITFLRYINALKPAKKIEKRLELWDDAVNLEPFYEGIVAQLKTMLIKHHYPEMYKKISEGHVYSHWGLTQIGEAVTYFMEYLKKEDLLNPVDEILEEESTKRWIEEYIDWYDKHREEIKEQNRKANATFKEDMKRTEEMIEKIKDGRSLKV